MHFSKQFIILDSIDSTNNYALQLIKDNKAVEGTAIFAHNQTQGKGQMGKIWIAQPCKNINLSVILGINDALFVNRFLLSISSALAAFNLVNKYTPPNTCSIKWPNDIYFKDKKTGGILIETCLSPNGQRYAVVGIGINVNGEIDNGQQALQKAISLQQITSNSFNILALAKELWQLVLLQHKQALTLPAANLLNNYNHYLYKKNQSVTLRKGNIAFVATIKQVNILGQLMVQNCLWDSFTVGEVSWQ